MNSSALRTAARSGGPPRQTRTASGGALSVAKASLATTPMPVERMWPTKAERVQEAGSDTHKWKPTGSARIAALRQDRRGEALAFDQFLAYRGEQRVAGTVGDPARRQRHGERRGHHSRGADRRGEQPAGAHIRRHHIGDPQAGAEAFGEPGHMPGDFRRDAANGGGPSVGRKP